jgi:uncharacterized protein
MAWLLPIGLLAGLLTTVTGIGGGIVALSLLSLVMSSAAALAISAAAFAIGNGHRATMYACSVERQITAQFSGGLAVGAIAAAAAVPRLPAAALHGALIAVAFLALAKLLYDRVAKRSSAIDPDAARLTSAMPIGSRWPTYRLVIAGIVIGAIGSGAGGAGVMVSPVLLRCGLRGEAYVATVASCAIVLNTARVVGYAIVGLYDLPMLPLIGALSVALVVGNLLGRWLRRHLSPVLIDRIELGAPVAAIAVTLLAL